MRNINTKELKIRYFLLVFFLGISVASAFAQIKIMGTVTDASNQSTIPGVSVVVKGTTSGTLTDINGKYAINADEKAVLVFSFIGYTSQEVPVTGQTKIDVSLSIEAKLLEQVVVTGYQSQKKADLTGAVSVVNVKELQKMPNNNPIQALQGRVPGMVVTTDGSPSGSNVSINIRGIGSINGTNPLYVIDGVSTTSGMHELNPNDIESIQVLKDASAASIYGSRASNGVIIITTKKAKKGDLNVTANAHTSFSWYGTKLSVLDAQGYGQAVWQASANDGAPLDHYLSYNFDWGYDAQGKAVLNQISLPEYIDPLTRTMKTSDTKWFDEISQSAFSQNYDVSVLHGTEKSDAMFSLDYTNNQGIVKTTDLDRKSVV